MGIILPLYFCFLCVQPLQSTSNNIQVAKSQSYQLSLLPSPCEIAACEQSNVQNKYSITISRDFQSRCFQYLDIISLICQCQSEGTVRRSIESSGRIPSTTNSTWIDTPDHPYPQLLEAGEPTAMNNPVCRQMYIYIINMILFHNTPCTKFPLQLKTFELKGTNKIQFN